MSFHFRMRGTPGSSAEYEPMLPEAPEIYQVNNFGLDTIYRALSTAQVLDERSEPPNFDATLPDWLSPERVDEIMDALDFGDDPDPPVTEEEQTAIREAQVAQQSLLEVTSPHPGQIPAFKFGSNDGWVITADECVIISTALKRVLGERELFNNACPTDESRTLLIQFGQYVQAAGATGGFVVH